MPIFESSSFIYLSEVEHHPLFAACLNTIPSYPSQLALHRAQSPSQCRSPTSGTPLGEPEHPEHPEPCLFAPSPNVQSTPTFHLVECLNRIYPQTHPNRAPISHHKRHSF